MTAGEQAAAAWYLDAWSVRDGMAFASRRGPGERKAGRSCVYLAVPGLEPEPTTNTAAALWADRAGFQPGLHDMERREVAFASLAQIREVVRRGYLAGGIGPDSAAAPAVPLPPGDGPDDGGPAASLAELAEPPNFPGGGWLLSRDDPQRCQRWLAEADHADQLWRGLQAFADASATMWLRGSTAASGADTALGNLTDWVLVLRQLGLWTASTAFVTALLDKRRPDLPVDFEWLLRSTGITWALDGIAADVPRLLHLAPCPLKPGWHASIRSIADKLLLSVSVAGYFDHNRGMAELVPSLLASVLTVGAYQRPWHSHGPRHPRDLLSTALDWLRAQMPQVELPTAAADAVTDFAWKQLDRPRGG
jgi:hypothetical protein